MANFNKINEFCLDLGNGVHALGGTAALTVALTAAANAPVATNTVLANLTQISYTNLSTRALASITWTNPSTTVGRLNAADLVLTASGAVATFRYVVLYNDTPTTPKADPLIGWYDYASDVTLANTETFTIDWTTSILDIT